MPNAFDLSDDRAYRSWRARKLDQDPPLSEQLAVEIRRLSEPSQAERAALRERVAAYNVALVRVRPEDVTPEAILALGRALGLTRTDDNLFADDRAVSRIAAAPQLPRGREPAPANRADFIPYTNKPLRWHTDGYYNAPEDQVLAWTLFCARPAREGGVNSLLDPEVAYIRLRDATDSHIAALAHPEALRIPPNWQHGRLIRPDSVGPVFSIRDGYLHMRYSARARNVIWRSSAETTAARDALTQLFSVGDAFTLTHRLAAGEGFITNNVLHSRTGFSDGDTVASQRLLYRVRYRERIR
ncbi:TauD/TfdA family dioxygenase [Thiorhodococcus minor]|uniref:TauD/TfdA family dioxygenase n=1 Tax=Thiorhodococcus minor TaxID=57489 RepID=A0A6M0JVV9_9GAMM|nr:TauD/TfdA family dioxygenase [Thiorhodococcus minor]